MKYLKPGPGKKYPTDSKADDIWHWQTSLFVDDAALFYEKLKAANVQFISKEPVIVNGAFNNKYKTFLVRDPDGHALQISELFRE